jgi:hypothetical protein
MKATAIFTGRREFLLMAAQNGKDRIQACPVVKSNLRSSLALFWRSLLIFISPTSLGVRR